jgi:hypothetical protein
MANERPKAEEATYDRAELLAGSKAIFGVRREVLVGALHGIKKDKLSVAECKAAIEEFLKREV